jgi:phosphate transport system substrate-binding protein
MKFKLFLPVVYMMSVLMSCHSSTTKKTEELDTPTSGEIAIAVDASFSPLIAEELKTFHLMFPEAKINVHYAPEPEVVKSLLDNQVPLAIIPRSLSEDENGYFIQEKIPVQQIKIGTDALAFVINRENRDSNFTYQQVVDVLSGKITRWNEINSSSVNDSIVLVFDNRSSSTIHYLEEEILKGAHLTNRAFAVDSEAMVRNYVEQNHSAIGVIDVSRISDTDQDSVKGFLRSIRVVAISERDSLSNPEFFKPSRYNMLYRKYPFLRDPDQLAQPLRQARRLAELTRGERAARRRTIAILRA